MFGLADNEAKKIGFERVNTGIICCIRFMQERLTRLIKISIGSDQIFLLPTLAIAKLKSCCQRCALAETITIKSLNALCSGSLSKRLCQ